MKLLTATLFNFRQYEGESRIRFSTDPSKPVTVFHGANGGGKTTLLNAFTWCLCGTFTPNFSNPGRVISDGATEKATPGETISCHVEVEFEHHRNRYAARRSCVTTKTTHGSAASTPDSVLSLVRTNSAGESQIIDSPRRLLEQIIPASLISFFFFDGERIEALSRPDKAQQKEVAIATRSMMGVEVITRAISHLRGGRGRRGVKRTLEDELEKDASVQVKELLTKKHELEAQREEAESHADTVESEARASRQEVQSIDAQLRELGPAAELQKTRDHIVQALSEKRAHQDLNHTELCRIVAEKGHLAPLGSAAHKVVGQIERLKLSGHLPSGIKRHFVDGLINEGKCICHRLLEEQDGSLQALREWRDRAGLADIESRALGLAGQFQDLDRRLTEFRGDLENSLNTRRIIAVELDRLEEQQNDVSKKLRKLPQYDVASLEMRRASYDAKNRELEKQVAVARHEAKQLFEKISDIEKRLKKEEERESLAISAQRRLDICQSTLTALEKLQKIVEDDVRDQLQQRIQDVFGLLAFKGYRPRLSEDYSLGLYRTGGDMSPVAMSAGESQILSLSFITSIIDMLRERNSDEVLGSRSPYPMVMDSPFGTLDPVHRMQVAEGLPKLAPQIILMVSETQWDGDVQEQMSPAVGGEYVITFFSGSKDVKVRTIQRGNAEYELVARSSTEYDYAKFTEVSR